MGSISNPLLGFGHPAGWWGLATVKLVPKALSAWRKEHCSHWSLGHQGAVEESKHICSVLQEECYGSRKKRLDMIQHGTKTQQMEWGSWWRQGHQQPGSSVYKASSRGKNRFAELFRYRWFSSLLFCNWALLQNLRGCSYADHKYLSLRC